MGSVTPITAHDDYIPSKVEASKFYLIDSALDENCKTLYEYLLTIAKQFDVMTYVSWATTGEAIDELLKSNWGRDLQIYVIKGAFATLRKNRYLRFQYDTTLEARIMELMEFIGESVKG